MIRYFLVMAVTGGSLLVADFVIGLFATGDPHGPGAIARGVHILFSLATVVVLLGIHSIVYTYFVATGKWAKEVVDRLSVARLDQRAGQEEQAAGVSLHHVEHDGDRRGRLAGRRRRYPRLVLCDLALGSAALALAFNLGSFVVEYAVIVAHVRLLTELKDRADRLRRRAVRADRRRNLRRSAQAAGHALKRHPGPAFVNVTASGVQASCPVCPRAQ